MVSPRKTSSDCRRGADRSAGDCVSARGATTSIGNGAGRSISDVTVAPAAVVGGGAPMTVRSKAAP